MKDSQSPTLCGTGHLQDVSVALHVLHKLLLSNGRLLNVVGINYPENDGRAVWFHDVLLGVFELYDAVGWPLLALYRIFQSSVYDRPETSGPLFF